MSNPEPVPDLLGDPLDLQRQVIPSRILEPMPFQVEDELLPELPKSAVGGILLGEVDPLPPPGQPGLVGATGAMIFSGGSNDVRELHVCHRDPRDAEFCPSGKQRPPRYFNSPFWNWYARPTSMSYRRYHYQ